jgi:hypothetical protein
VRRTIRSGGGSDVQASPDLQPAQFCLTVPGHLFYLVFMRSGSTFMENICTSIRPSEHTAQCVALHRFCSLHRLFSNAIGIASNLVSDAGLPSSVEYKRQTSGPPMRSHVCLNRGWSTEQRRVPRVHHQCAGQGSGHC